MYFIGSGRGAVRIKGTGNIAVRVATVGPGAIVGEVAFYADKPRNASVVAESPMTAWRFSRASLVQLQKEMPDLAVRFHAGIAAMMAARLTSTNRLVGFLAD
jgi:SulP family sulfate permease